MKCIFINRKIINEFAKNNIKSNTKHSYTDDIIQISINKNIIPNNISNNILLLNNNILFKDYFSHNLLGWSNCYKYDNLPELIVLSERPKDNNLTSIFNLERKYPCGSPKAIAINKLHRIWGNSIFCLKNGNDLTRDFFIKNYYKKSFLMHVPDLVKFNKKNSPKSMICRYNTAQKYLNLLCKFNILTTEGAWILFAKDLAGDYVHHNHGFYQTTFCHSLYEYNKKQFILDTNTIPRKHYNMFDVCNHKYKPIHPTKSYFENK